MFGIDCCDVKMKSRYYLKFSTNVFMIESLVSSSSSFNFDILVLACLLLKQTFAVQETCETNFVFY